VIWRSVYFFAKYELFKNRIFGTILRWVHALPVKRGAFDRQAISESLKVIQKGYGLTVFPEGTRSLSGTFLPAKPGVGLMATKAGCSVVPAYIHGSNNLKACFWGKERLSVTFGEPITPDWIASVQAGREGYQKIADEIMARILQIKNRVIEKDG
jgi:1-acyl-sn-glycerol-3-phosphate acyltransferase